MQHLNCETLARLLDEAPAPAEARHLNACTACSAELEALREQTRALASLSELAPPPDGWEGLRMRLAAEDLIGADDTVLVHAAVDAESLRSSAVSALPGQPRSGYAGRPWARPLLQLAAGLVLFLAGGVTGAAFTGSGDAQPTAEAVLGAPPTAYATPEEEAAEALRDAEDAYFAALERYAEFTEPPEQTDPAARLAALEGIVLTTRAALADAPADPVINGYHLTALGQRDAMLRQIAQRSDDTWF